MRPSEGANRIILGAVNEAAANEAIITWSVSGFSRDGVVRRGRSCRQARGIDRAKELRPLSCNCPYGRESTSGSATVPHARKTLPYRGAGGSARRGHYFGPSGHAGVHFRGERCPRHHCLSQVDSRTLSAVER